MGPIKKIQYNCKQATFLIEKRLIDRLTLREKVEQRIHLAGCSVCRMFAQQSKMINTMVRQLFNQRNDPAMHLDEDFKKDLQNRIEEELNKD